MKRSKQSSRTMRRLTAKQDSVGNSQYAIKLTGGKQMYGGRGKLSCCAHEFVSSYSSRVWGSENRGGKPNTVDERGNRVFIPKRAA